MTVSGFETKAQAEQRAAFYRSRGYRVTIVEVKSEKAGSYLYLSCTYGEA
ncbi:MAG: hypothetical protein VYA35_06980 [Pseudomonadota bacterium]|nr:hypothetical protein [Pseudomonadota bacterium]